MALSGHRRNVTKCNVSLRCDVDWSDDVIKIKLKI